MRTWRRKGYKIEERDFDCSLHVFAIIQDDWKEQIIYPATLEDMQEIIADLDAGAEVKGWEDGNGNDIIIVGYND